jgi:hypothetical protein
LANDDTNTTAGADLHILKSFKQKPSHTSQDNEAVVNTESNLNDEILHSNKSTKSRKHGAISKIFSFHSSPKQHSDHAFHDCVDIQISELGELKQMNESEHLCKSIFSNVSNQ